MPLHASWTTVTCSGTYVGLDGTVPTGKVAFIPSTRVVLDTGSGDQLVLPRIITAELDATGAFEVELPVTDDASCSPTGWTYKVVENIRGGRDPFFISVLTAAGDFDLTTATPVDEVDVAAVGFADSVRAVLLTGLSLATSTAITAADTILSAFGKLQAQVSLKVNSITSYAAKNPPVDADEFPLADSAAAFAQKKSTWAQIKAALFASPSLTGVPTAPTAAALTATTQVATTAFVTTATTRRCFDEFGCVGTGVAEDKLGLNRALKWAMDNGGTLIGRSGAVYPCDEETWSFTTNGVLSSFVLTGAVAEAAENFWVRLRANAISANYNANSGITLRPGTDFSYDSGTQTLTLLGAYAAYAAVDADNLQVGEGLYIQASNVTIDGNGCAFTGSARFTAAGAPTTAGQVPPLANIHFQNFRCIDYGAWEGGKGPILHWCRSSSVENVFKIGLTGTAFNLHMCWDSRILNCTNEGSSSGFGWLLFHCRRCVVENVICTDLVGEVNLWPLVGQIKGGWANKAINCVAVDCTGAGVADYAFYCRGDDPSSAGGTVAFGIYPYATGSWTAADSQRNTRDAEWVECVAEYSPSFAGTKLVTGFQCQQFISALFERCRSINAGSFKANKTAGGSEEIATYQGCRVRSGVDRGFEFLGASSSELLTGVRLFDCRVDTAVGDGIRLTNMDAPLISGCVINAAGGTGIVGPSVRDVRIIDTRVTGGAGTGVSLSGTTLIEKGAYLRNVEATGNATNWNIDQPADAEGLRVAFNTRNTTTATVTTVDTLTIPDGQIWNVVVEAQARVTGGAVSCFRSRVAVTSTAGTAALIGAQSNSADATFANTDALGGLTLDVSGQTLRVRVAGKAATTVDWELTRVSCQRIE
jgi:hypothetical protein